MKTRELLAMRRENPEELQRLLAQKAVNRGIDWLSRNAPIGWHRNLFEPIGDRAAFRAMICMDNCSPLALAFESRKDLIDPFGYVTYGTVARHFKLSLKTLTLLGLDPPGNKRPYITLQMLDRLWEQTLRERSKATIPHRYRTPEEERQWQRVMEFDFSLPSGEPSFWERLRRFYRYITTFKETKNSRAG
jgi:hypothetical protein